jgi:hypothetical protein
LLAPTSSGTTRYSITSAKMKNKTTRRAGLASSDSQGRHSRKRPGDGLWPAPGTPASSPAAGGSPAGGSPATGASSLDRMLHSYPILPAYPPGPWSKQPRG